MCTAVVGGSIHRAATKISAASDQRSTTPMTSHRTKDRRKPVRRGVWVCVSGIAVTFQNNSLGWVMLTIRWPSKSFARAARNASVTQFESCAPLRPVGLQRDAFRLIAGNANVAARIHNARRRTVQTQDLDRAVNGVSFSNSAQVNPQGQHQASGSQSSRES